MRSSGEGRIVPYEAFFRWFEGKRVLATEIVLSRLRLPFPSLPTPKNLLLPQREALYRFFWEKRTWHIAPCVPSQEKVFLLCAPCEAKAVTKVLDAIFLESVPQDTSYRKRRENLSLFAVGCTFFAATCFCTRVGGHPLSREGAEGFALPLPFGVYLEGEGPEGRPPEPPEEEELGRITAHLERSAPPPFPERTPEHLFQAFGEATWEEVAWGCLSCGACTFLCPTCFCFDLVPEGKLRGAMIRTWDSCMFPKFTLHASSHNPRPHPMQRVRQRVLHKFSYFPLRKGCFSCVGCGRCVLACPVNWSIQEAVERVVSGAK